MSEKFEVWDILGTYNPFASDDPVVIVHWLRANPDRIWNVHPSGPNFHNSTIAHDFIWRHRMAVAEDLVKRAFDAGEPQGLAQEIGNLFWGR